MSKPRVSKKKLQDLAKVLSDDECRYEVIQCGKKYSLLRTLGGQTTALADGRTSSEMLRELFLKWVQSKNVYIGG